ncbi:MAG: right-handed parallel beta-helix repeat-containing protein [Pirellulaceae bacterium]
MIRSILSTVFIVLSIGQTIGATYYVRKSGNDANNGRSRNQAFQTISKATSEAKQGDTVYIGGGTYQESVVWDVQPSGAGYAMLYGDVNGGFTGDRGEVIMQSPGNAWNLQIRNGNAVLINSITFRQPDSSQRGYGIHINNNAAAVYFVNCKFTDLTYGIYHVNSNMLLAYLCQFDGNQYGIYSSKASDIVAMASSFGANQHAIYCRESTSVQAQTCKFSAQHAVSGESVAGNGLYAYRSKVTVTSSTFDQARNGIYGDQTTDVSIQECTFTECSSYGISLKGEGLEVSKCASMVEAMDVCSTTPQATRVPLRVLTFKGCPQVSMLPEAIINFQTSQSAIVHTESIHT